MTTTLANCRIELSKQIGDYWASALTEAGTSKTIVDTLLTEKTNNWISDAPHEHYALVVDGDYAAVERKAVSLDISTGILTLNSSVGGTLASGVAYEIHRLSSAAEKKRALIHACKSGFPYIFKQVRDTSLTVGNWLRNGDLESNWLTSATNTYWVASVSTLAKYTTAPYFTRGATSMRITGSAGSVYQSNTENTDLIDLAGCSVTFTAQVWCNTATNTRLSINDGTTTTYSSYHSGGSTFEELSVTVTIADSPSAITFSINKGATSTTYADDFRVIGPSRDKLYIGDLGLAQNYPHEIRQSADSSIDSEPWQLIREYEIGSDGYLYLEEGSQDSRLRICGIGYLDFLASGVSSTAWTATVDIDSPQTDILIAEAVMYLYTQMIMPNYTSGERDSFAKILQYWEAELADRRLKFGMKAPPAYVKWGTIGGSGYKSAYGRTQY